MDTLTKNVQMDVAGRNKDVQIHINKNNHGDIFLSVTPRESQKEKYDGPYAVWSLADEAQILETSDKVMSEDLIVLPIPYIETSNPKGGVTVYIGGN